MIWYKRKHAGNRASENQLGERFGLLRRQSYKPSRLDPEGTDSGCLYSSGECRDLLILWCMSLEMAQPSSPLPGAVNGSALYDSQKPSRVNCAAQFCRAVSAAVGPVW